MELLGIKDAIFKDKDTGEIIPYLHLHAADVDRNVVGRASVILKVKSDRFDYVRSLGLQPGDNIKVTYDKFTKVEDVIIE